MKGLRHTALCRCSRGGCSPGALPQPGSSPLQACPTRPLAPAARGNLSLLWSPLSMPRVATYQLRQLPLKDHSISNLY